MHYISSSAWRSFVKSVALYGRTSPIVADLYMGHWERDLEQLALASGGKVHAFCRYADDFLVLFEGSDDVINDWVDSLKGHVNLEIFGLVHLNHAAGFLHSNSGVKMS